MKLSRKERRAMAQATGIAEPTLKSYGLDSSANGHRWPSADQALLIDEHSEAVLGRKITAGDICPACSGCPYWRKSCENK